MLNIDQAAVFSVTAITVPEANKAVIIKVLVLGSFILRYFFILHGEDAHRCTQRLGERGYE